MDEKTVKWTPGECKCPLEWLFEVWADVFVANVTTYIRGWQRVWNRGTGLTYIAIFGIDHLHGRQLRERETNGN
ncbi:hypothetical protein KIN20_035268 [Parelaphostrongylus tenuis]|uniref:Uncharacterized protein n=1 Tax=Parelaphostrongylus tenuis TaxID=148309 RepID=A0AAD5RAX7_PARTN|nr:hypothetical protein KIN20_035268 [Parelaphostrongylus tenuis]